MTERKPDDLRLAVHASNPHDDADFQKKLEAIDRIREAGRVTNADLQLEVGPIEPC